MTKRWPDAWWVKFWNREVLAPECDSLCQYRPCYRPSENKGTYNPGRGYTSYHSEPEPVCAERQDRGCNGHDNVVRGGWSHPDFTALLTEVEKPPSASGAYPKRTTLRLMQIVKMLIWYIGKLHEKLPTNKETKD